MTLSHQEREHWEVERQDRDKRSHQSGRFQAADHAPAHVSRRLYWLLSPTVDASRVK